MTTAPQPRRSLRRTTVAAMVPARAEETLSSEEQSILEAAQQWSQASTSDRSSIKVCR